MLSFCCRPEYSTDMNGMPRPIKERKKHDRFNGMPEEEVSKRTLPDHLTSNLDIIIVSSTLIFVFMIVTVCFVFRLVLILDYLRLTKVTTMQGPATTSGSVSTCQD